MNVREVVEVVLSVNGGKRFDKTCDQLIEGDWERKVNGVVTTFMATVEVIRETIRAGSNMIITHEPTYFTGSDSTGWVEGDQIYQKKKALIDDNRVSIWRYHDHMHMGHSDLIYAGLLKTMGWAEYLDGEMPQPHCYSIPSTTVADLVGFLKKALGLGVVRVIGDPGMKCSRVGILVGGGSLGLGHEEMPARLMHDRRLDVMLCGEITEWTLASYVRDAASLGFNKAMIVVGHERSEGPGMRALADLLKPLLPGIPVRFADAGEPFAYV